MTTAGDVIEAFRLRPHPEGGWYAETWRSPSAPGERPASSAILYLLQDGERSHWHRVDADEIWQFSAGDPLDLRIAMTDGGPVVRHRLGNAVTSGDEAQVVVPAGAWQAARPLGDWTLVGCIVAPAFSFDGFELAPEGWEPGDQERAQHQVGNAHIASSARFDTQNS
jgi:predicted cupin superfamily sugar epimerase